MYVHSDLQRLIILGGAPLALLIRRPQSILPICHNTLALAKVYSGVICRVIYIMPRMRIGDDAHEGRLLIQALSSSSAQRRGYQRILISKSGLAVGGCPCGEDDKAMAAAGCKRELYGHKWPRARDRAEGPTSIVFAPRLQGQQGHRTSGHPARPTGCG